MVRCRRTGMTSRTCSTCLQTSAGVEYSLTPKGDLRANQGVMAMSREGASAPSGGTGQAKALKGVFSPNPEFFYKRARLVPHELIHVRASPGDCAAGWAQAWREI